jgi:hypothetical protein
MTTSIVPGAVAPKDCSILSMSGSAQILVGFNSYRTHLQMQPAPTGGGIWYSYTNPNVAAGATGCYFLSAGAVWAPAIGVPENPIYVLGTSGQALIASEC